MPTLELNGKPFAEQTGTGEPVLKGNINFEGPIRINNQEVLSANGGTISTSAAVFEGSSANAIVRITQTGSGNALVVEDSANPDSTPFVVNASGNVGIGTSSPNEMMTIASSSVASYLQICDNSTGSTSGDGLFLGSFNGAAELRTKENTHLSFGTNNTQHMRIDSSGNVGLTGGGTLSFYSGASVVGSIVPSSIGTTYNTTSDFRLKDNIQPISDGTEKLMAMNPVSHTWKADPKAPSVHGFIAQEMLNIIPEAVSGTPDGEEMMTMDYGRITPVIVAALKDALCEIEQLKTRINELEAK